MKIIQDKDFSITIDFDKHSPNPARIFKTMTSLIESFEEIDRSLVKYLDNKIETVLLLEDVDKGSLKTIFANLLEGIPDEAIKDFDWKKIVGHYLLKAKYIILDKTQGVAQITDGKIIDAIREELNTAAKETGVDKLPMYAPVNKATIISDINSISKSLQSLNEGDSVYYDSEYGRATFNLMLSIDSERMEDLLTNERYESTTPMILKVKKPDFLGDSMWDFKHGNKTIQAKITDKEWLNAFQNRKCDVRPQDSIVCEVKTTAKYDYDFELISTTYEVVKVTEVRPRSNPNQLKLIED